MKKKKTFLPNTPTINRIDVDEKTNEPVLVEVPLEELPQEPQTSEEDRIIEESARLAKEYENKSHKELGKQIAMTRIMGITTKDNTDVTKKQRLFKNIFTVLFIVFVVGVLVFTFYNDFFADNGDRPIATWEDVKGVFGSWYFLLLAILMLGLCYLFKGAKLSIMCKSLTGKAHFKTSLETGIVGHYYNNVTPLAVGGQPFEIYHLSKHGVHGGVASSLPIATFFLNQFAFVILGIASIILYRSNALGVPQDFLNNFSGVATVFNILAIIGCALCFFMPALVVLFSLLPRTSAAMVHFVMWLGGKLRLLKKPKETEFKTMKTVVQNAKCLKKIATRPFVFISTFFLSFLEQFSNSSIAYFTLKFFGFNIAGVGGVMEWLIVMQFCFILYASISFIPTPGNSGAADLSFYLLFDKPLAVGFAFPAMVVWRFLSFYSYILIGFIFTTLKKKSDAKKNTPQNRFVE